MANTDLNVTLAKRWFEEVWNERKTDLIHDLLLPTSVCHTDQGDMIGPDAFLAFHFQMLQTLPDLKVVVEDSMAKDDCVAVRWSASATHTKPMRFQGVAWIRYENGKMVEGWDCWNFDGLIRELLGEAQLLGEAALEA